MEIRQKIIKLEIFVLRLLNYFSIKLLIIISSAYFNIRIKILILKSIYITIVIIKKRAKKKKYLYRIKASLILDVDEETSEKLEKLDLFLK